MSRLIKCIITRPESHLGSVFSKTPEGWGRGTLPYSEVRVGDSPISEVDHYFIFGLD